jgi:hypothetical protein
MRPRFAAVPTLLFVIALAGCENSPNAPVTENGPRFDYLNGPDDLPNVSRFEQRYTVNFTDPTVGLRLFAGLPTVPSSHINCRVFGFTGSERFQLRPIQQVGADEGPIVQLITDDDVNVHIYQTSTFMGFCRSTIYAQGVVRMTATDNDLFFESGHTNVWGWHFTGTVTILATGEEKQLNAVFRFLSNPQTGEFKILRRDIQLI